MDKEKYTYLRLYVLIWIVKRIKEMAIKFYAVVNGRKQKQ